MSTNRSRLFLALAFGTMTVAVSATLAQGFGTGGERISWLVLRPASFLMQMFSASQGLALSESQMTLVTPLGVLLCVACWSTAFYLLFAVRDVTLKAKHDPDMS
jgi:hypothetical protein